MSSEEFIAWLGPTASEVCRSYQLPASVCIAQAALESGWGRYVIGQYNLFGRKYNGSGLYVELETQEYLDNQWQTVLAKFQDYSSLEEAVNDWCILLTEEPAYASCLEHKDDVAAFVAAVAPVYATDPDYADKVLATIQANRLLVFDGC